MKLIHQPWRLRAYLQALPEGSLAGRRGHPNYCPLGCWLSYEMGIDHVVGLGGIRRRIIPEESILPALLPQWTSVPLWIQLFIRAVDACPPGDVVDTLVDRDEALQVLDQVERTVAQLQLPQWSSASQCVHHDRAGRRCAARGLYHVHALVGEDPVGPTEFIEVNGLLCEEHWERVVIPPPVWWQAVEESRLAAIALAGG